MKKLYIILAVLLTALIIVSVFSYCFVPINPAVSKEITRATPMLVTLNSREFYGYSVYDLLKRIATMKDEDMNFFDELYFSHIVSKLEPIDYTVSACSDMQSTMFVCYIVEEISENEQRIVSLKFMPTGDKRVFYVIMRTYTLKMRGMYADTEYSDEVKYFRVRTNYDKFRDKYFEIAKERQTKRGIKEQAEKEAAESQAYSDAMERIKNGGI